jgi:uncharacterized protein HemX
MFSNTMVSVAASAVIAVLAYFLKKQNDKIESMDAKLGQLRELLSGELKLTKKEVVGLFHDICHERQESCYKVVATRLEGMQRSYDVLCQKIDLLRQDRAKDWDRQYSINEKLKVHMHRRHDDNVGEGTL